MAEDFSPKMPLSEARELLYKKIWGEQSNCPCCDQVVKVRKRAIHYGMIKSLQAIAQLSGKKNRWVQCDEFQKITIAQDVSIGGDYAKLSFWGLIESLDIIDEDAKKSARAEGWSGNGCWRMTKAGWLFLRNKLSIPEYLLFYNNKLLGKSEKNLLISQMEIDKFDWNEMMRPIYEPPDGIDEDNDEEQLTLL